MNMGKQITDLAEGSAIPGESRYPVSMGDGTGVKQVKHSTLVGQLLSDMELPYDETMALLTGTEEDEDEDGEENGKQKIPNLQAISDWIMSKIVNNLLATEEGFFLDARIGPVLDQRISANANAITQINSDLVNFGKVKSAYILGNQSVEFEFTAHHCYLFLLRDGLLYIQAYSTTLHAYWIVASNNVGLSFYGRKMTVSVTIESSIYFSIIDLGNSGSNASGTTVQL